VLLYSVIDINADTSSESASPLPFFPFRPEELADGLHEVVLAQPDTAINEERIVRARWRLRDSETRSMRDFVVRTDDKRFKGVSRIKSGNGCAWPCLHLRRG